MLRFSTLDLSQVEQVERAFHKLVVEALRCGALNEWCGKGVRRAWCTWYERVASRRQLRRCAARMCMVTRRLVDGAAFISDGRGGGAYGDGWV